MLIYKEGFSNLNEAKHIEIGLIIAIPTVIMCVLCIIKAIEFGVSPRKVIYTFKNKNIEPKLHEVIDNEEKAKVFMERLRSLDTDKKENFKIASNDSINMSINNMVSETGHRWQIEFMKNLYK
jgi:hypothetical protein